MAQRKTQQELEKSLLDSLSILDINIQLVEAGNNIAWFPIATELYRLLSDTNSRSGPLLKNLYPNLELNQLKIQPNTAIEWLWWVPSYKIKDGKIEFDLFDTSSLIDIDSWLAQVIFTNKGFQITVEEMIVIVRHNISAHTSKTQLTGKARAITDYLNIYEAGKNIEGFSSLIVQIGIHVLEKTKEMLGITGIYDLVLFKKSEIVKIWASFDKGYKYLESIVSSLENFSIEGLDNATKQLELPVNILNHKLFRGKSYRIYTFLSEARRIMFEQSKNKLFLYKSLAALEHLYLLLDEDSDTNDRLLIIFNLGLAYENASKYIHRKSCLESSLHYFSQVIDTNNNGNTDETVLDATKGAERVCRKLFRFKKAREFKKLAIVFEENE